MNKVKLLLFIGVLFVGSSYAVIHKFYVSVTQVEYNPSQQSLQIVSRVFVDDLEDLLRERYDASISLNKDNTKTETDRYIATYFAKKITFEVNEKPVTFNFIGTEYEDDLIVCYLEVENIAAIETIKIKNQLLLDLFKEQQNIIHVKKGNQRKSLILEEERDTGMLKFSK
ncbi:DUF6702 family protein [Aquimarina sp. 2201CG1-2-11]|uniref:DUF6702 family protein n=1 Tax=Aquimarina discodermiae TaxID=3231043 RepID=UPI003462A1AD